MLQSNLPSGLGSVTIAAGSAGTYTVTVSVQWNDQAGGTAFGQTTGSNTQTYTVVSAL